MYQMFNTAWYIDKAWSGIGYFAGFQRCYVMYYVMYYVRLKLNCYIPYWQQIPVANPVV